MSQSDHPFSLPAIKVYLITILFYSIVYMVLMVIPFHATLLGGTKTDIGLIMGATMLTSMFARPIAGRLIDRHGAGRIFWIVLILFAASLFGYLVPSLWMLGLVRVVQGIVAAFFSTAMEIMTIDLLSDRVRGQGLSLYSLSTMIPSTFGPAIALYLVDQLAMREIFLIFIGFGLVNAVLAVMMARSTGTDAIKQTMEPQRLAIIAPERMWKHRSLWISSFIMLLASIANGAIFTFLPLYLEHSQSSMGSFYFLTQTLVLVLCRFVGRSFIPSDGTTPTRLIGFTLLLAAAGSSLLSVSVQPAILIAAAVLNGIAFALMYPTLLTYVSFTVPDQARGLLLGLFIGAADCGFALGALAMGPLIDLFSYPMMYISCAVCCLLACLLLWGYKPAKTNQTRTNHTAL